MAKDKTVSIRFTQKSYVLLKSYNFRTAGVFAEFIDNSIQSFIDNKSILQKRKGYQLLISIEKSGKNIIIKDNAAGISDKNMQKAFEPGNVEIGKKGLNEFGIGMKNAAVWMSNFYSVKTKALDENYSKQINFDYKAVIENEIEDLKIEYVDAPFKSSFTEIVLKDLKAPVDSFNLDSTIQELSSIYRIFLASGEVQISFFGHNLKYKYPTELIAPYYPDILNYKKNGGNKPTNYKWRFDFKPITYNGKTVRGFVAILGKIQKNSNGLSYFRNGRVIEGAGDQKLFPSAICGVNGSHQQKRIFGELHFDQSIADIGKGKLLDVDDVNILIKLLSEQLKLFKPSGSSKTYSLIRQANELRLSDDVDENKTINKLQEKNQKLEKLKEKKEYKDKEEKKYEKILQQKLPNNNKLSSKKAIKIDKDEEILKTIPGINGEKYLLRYTIKKDDTSDLLYEIQIEDVADRGEKKLLKEGVVKIITGYVNLMCPFLTNNDQLLKGKSEDAFYEIIESLMITEAIATIKGVKNADYFRETFNSLIN